jgi:DNA-binding NtrC family response regulator
MHVAALRHAETFERCAGSLLEAVNREAERDLAPLHDGTARVLRSLVHMRPESHYRRVAMLESGKTREGKATPIAPSATAWRWVSEHARPAFIDVQTSTIEVGSGPESMPVSAALSSPWETQMQLLAREATHVLAVPVFGARGEVEGMVTVEVACPAAIGLPLFAPELVAHVEMLVDVSAPYLRLLPSDAAPLASDDPLLPVVGRSMVPIVSTLRAFAAQDETILLSGETGVGKSRLARYCHERSPRAKARFEAVHLSSKPAGLRMGELFGWKRGAFTGATSDHVGHLGRAEKGTLFIDEVDKLSLEDQAGLLQLLEEGRYRPLGDASSDHQANVRFILGTNANLKALVDEGAFREDLYYRIHVLPVRVPSLAERRDEIVSWATFMLRARHGRTGADIAPSAAVLLESHPWPGNLRQLDNVIRRAFALLTLDQDPTAPTIVLEGRHVERALAFEGEPMPRPLIDLLHAAATAFVVEAERKSLDLDLTDSFRGMVLRAAAEKTGSVEDAFRLFGREAVVEHRNHTKVLRKELARVEALCNALGVDPNQFTRTPTEDET